MSALSVAVIISSIGIPGGARDLHLAANYRSLASLGMTKSEKVELRERSNVPTAPAKAFLGALRDSAVKMT
jgi:hypothetical protein